MAILESTISPRRATLLARLATERSFLLQQLEGLDEATLTMIFKAFGPLAHHMVNAGQPVPRNAYRAGERLE